MSIYRKFEAMRLPSNDVHVPTKPSPTSRVNSVKSLQDSSDEEELKRRRKGEPANVPLPRTLDWVERLPSGVKPTALLRHYARIANVIAVTWDDPISFRSYMHCLCGNDRGSRKGFPPEILGELLALQEYRATFND